MSEFKISSVRIPNKSRTFRNADAWRVVITNPRGQKMQRSFFQGYAFKGAEPRLGDVLESLILDAACYAGTRDATDFMREFGYEEYAHALSAYKACQRTAERLETFLTPEEREQYESAE